MFFACKSLPDHLYVASAIWLVRSASSGAHLYPRFRCSFIRLKVAIACLPVLYFVGTQAAGAACVFVHTAGNDTFVCDSGLSGGTLTDLGGSNQLSCETFDIGGLLLIGTNDQFQGFCGIAHIPA